MILTRRTEPHRIILSFDSALRDLPLEQVQKYLMTRDLSVLPDLSALSERPSVFHVMPLLPRYEYLLQGNSPPESRRDLVRNHLVDAENVDGLRFEDGRDGRCLSRESVDSLPLTAINEIANIIAELQTRHAGELDFFTPPDTWRSIRRHVETLRLIA